MRQTLFKLSLWQGAPAYFWVKDISASAVRDALLEAVRERPNNNHVSDMLEAAAYLGKGTFKNALALIDSYKERLAKKNQKYPSGGPRSWRSQVRKPPKMSENAFRKECTRRLDRIADTDGQEPKVIRRWEAQELDIYLFARDDQYK